MFGPADGYVTVETRITHIMLKIDILIGCNEERGSFPLPAMSRQLVNDLIFINLSCTRPIFETTNYHDNKLK